MLVPFMLLLATQDPAPSETCNPCASYKDGFIVESADGLYRLRLRGLLQIRGVAEMSELDAQQIEPSLAIQRAQLEFGGHAYTKALTFQLKTEWGQGFTFLKDAYVNYVFVPEWLELRAGQWKRPFSRQELTGDASQAFIDRPITNGYFGGGRDIGVAVHNNVDKSPPIEWAFGVFTGSTDKPAGSGVGRIDPEDPKLVDVERVRLTNVRDPMLPTAVARIGFNRGDVKGYKEIDLDGGDLRFGVATSLLEAVDTNGGTDGVTRMEVDAIAKWAHVDMSGAIFVGAKQTRPASFEQAYDATGFHVQTGVLLFDQLHPGVRYDYIAVDGDNNDLQEVTAGVTWLALGPNVQLQLDTSALFDEANANVPDLRGRMQLNLAF